VSAPRPIRAWHLRPGTPRLLAAAVLLALIQAAIGCAPKRLGGAATPPPDEPSSPPAAAPRSSRDQDPGSLAVRTSGTDPGADFDLPRGTVLDTTGGIILDVDPRLALPTPSLRPRSGSGAVHEGEIGLGIAAAELALAQVGKPYAYGATGPDRFDCSGLALWVYGNLGVNLPRVARQQARAGRSVRLVEAQPGDLLCFALNGGSIDHVGLYLGGDRFVHAPRRGRPVTSEELSGAYWRPRLRDVRRVVFAVSE